MPEEHAFIAAIQADPANLTTWLVFADWLEEQGDPRCEAIRRDCRCWSPFSWDEVSYLQTVACARRAASEELVVWGFDRQRVRELTTPPSSLEATEMSFGLYRESLDTLRDDLAHISREKIARYFPREDDGRLPLKCDVLLAVYGCLACGGAALDASTPRLWLTASSPRRRRDRQVITLRLQPLVGRNQPYHWSQARELWDTRADLVRDIGAELPSFDNGGQLRSKLLEKHAAGELDFAERKTLTLLLQDVARFEEAFALWDLVFDGSLRAIIQGPSDPMLRGRFDLATGQHASVDLWKPALRRILWEAAPWRLAELVEDETQQRDRRSWQRHYVAPSLRLAYLPKRPGEAQRSLLLHMPYQKTDRAKLTLGRTRIDRVLPVTAWKRPVEIDLARLGLE